MSSEDVRICNKANTSASSVDNSENINSLTTKQSPPANCNTSYGEYIKDIDRFNTEEIIDNEATINTENDSNSSFASAQLTMAQKLENAAPYNYFLTKIASSPQTHTEPLSISFEEVLDPSLGELESSVQTTFCLDIEWLLEKYEKMGCKGTPLLVFWGFDQSLGDEEIVQENSHVEMEFVKCVGIQHAKVMLLGYKDKSMRVVVSSANAYEVDWHNRAQGLWMSPRLAQMPHISNASDGESPTGFRNDLITFLSWFKSTKLETWINRIRMTDFSAINVFLITSLPGQYSGSWRYGYPNGHPRVAWLLAQHAAPTEAPIIAQSSAVGNFAFSNWLFGEFINSFRCHSGTENQLAKVPKFQFVYPTMMNVFNSHDGIIKGGTGLPYREKIHRRQKWIANYMYEWKADAKFRTQSMPHIKTYARWSDNKLSWFLLSSGNMSRSAWGGFSDHDSNIFEIWNVEAGVLFLPKFVIGKDSFPLDDSEPDVPPFPMVLDIPLVPYTNQEPYRHDNIDGYVDIPKIIDGKEYVLDIETGDYVPNTPNVENCPVILIDDALRVEQQEQP